MNDAKVSLAVGGIALIVATSALVLALVERHRRRRIRLDGRAIHAGLQEYRAKTGTAGTLWSSSTTITSPSATSMLATVTAAPTEPGAEAETRCRSIYAHGGADHRCELIAGHSGPHRAPSGLAWTRSLLPSAHEEAAEALRGELPGLSAAERRQAADAVLAVARRRISGLHVPFTMPGRSSYAMEHYRDGWTHARLEAVAVLMDGGDR